MLSILACSFALAAEPAKPCCAAEPAAPAPAGKPCCAELPAVSAEASAKADAAFSTNSIYQFDAAWTYAAGGPVQLGVKFKQEADDSFSHSNIITVLNPEGEVVHQRLGLQGPVDEAAKALITAAR